MRYVINGNLILKRIYIPLKPTSLKTLYAKCLTANVYNCRANDQLWQSREFTREYQQIRTVFEQTVKWMKI